MFDVYIVGAGISGATLAERFATQLKKRVLVIEKRDHIGGNCYDYVTKEGLIVSKYGAHIFHTKYDHVWKYVNKFTSFLPYKHKVISHVRGKYVPVPVNISTVNMLFELNITNQAQMKSWLAKQVITIPNPQNSEESGLSRVGRELYNILFKNYTKKQWDKDPKQLDASVLNRIPVRTDFNDRYFSDPYEGIPKNGYTKLFEKMFQNKLITVRLNTDFFDIKDTLPEHTIIIYTGPIDRYFSYKFGKKLEYRSLRFEFETHNKEYYQSNSVINYPNDHEYTRIVEYKYLYRQKHPKTIISKEYPTWEGEPYYPVPSKKNQILYSKYQREAQKLEKKGIYFVGRLANYKYYNMDEAFKSALELFDKIKDDKKYGHS